MEENSKVFLFGWSFSPKQDYLVFALVLLRVQKKKFSNIFYLKTWTECGFQILVTKMCNEERISDIWTDFIPHISTNNASLFGY